MKETYLLALCLTYGAQLAGQTTVNLNNGDNNATAYDTTGNDTTFTLASGSATQSGVVSGTGNVIKTGAGAVEFTAVNSYTGSTDVQEGSLSLTKPTFSLSEIPWAFSPMTGISVGDSATASLSISGGVFVGNTGTVTLGNTSSGNGTLSIYNSLPPSPIGSLSNTGDIIVGNAGSGALNVTSIGLARSTGSVRLGAGNGGNGTVLVDDSALQSSSSIIVGEAANSYGSLTISNNGFVFAGHYLELGAGLGSEGHLTIESGGTLSLRNHASGDGLRVGAGLGTVSIDGGTLQTSQTSLTTSVPLAISNDVTFDTGGRVMTIHGDVSGSGSLDMIGSGEVILSANTTYTGGTTVSSGALRLGAGGASGSVVGDITNNGRVIFQRSDDYTYNGVISGSGALWNEGNILRLTSPQTYTGATEVRSGYLVLPTSIDQALAATTTIYIGSAGTLDISNRKLTVAGLTGGGQIYSFGGSAGELTVNTGAGPNQNYYGSLGSSFPNFSLVKTGIGTLILSGANTYTGATTVNDGTLIINGSTGVASTVTVNENGTLGGTGTISGVVNVAGTLAPGESPGTLNFQNSLSLESTATLAIEITDVGAGEFDVLNGDGSNTLSLGGFLTLDNTGYSATLGDSISIFTNWSTITGSFISISGTDLGAGLSWDTSNLYTMGTLSVVPEPSTYAALGGLLALGFAVWHRQRKA